MRSRSPASSAVTIATPPHTHAALVRAALAAGKHVLCEKPFARDTAEARTLLAAAEAAGVVHLLGTEFRFDAGQALLARVVRSGAIGEPRLALFALHVPVLAAADAELPAWWADAGEGGGWLGAHGSQVIDQVRATLGEFATVTASLVNLADRDVGRRRLRRALPDAVRRGGRDAEHRGRPRPAARSRRASSAPAAPRGSTGSAIACRSPTRTARDASRSPTSYARRRRRPRPPTLLTTDYERMIGHGLDLGPYTRLAEHFRARILGIDPPPGPAPATFADGVADMAVLDAMRASAATGQTVATVA